MKKLNKKYFIGFCSFCVLILAALFFLMRSIPGENLSALSISQLQEQIKSLQRQAENMMAQLGIMEEAEKTKIAISTEPDIIPPILANLEPEQVTDTSAVIFWETNELSNSKVIYSAQYHKNSEKMNSSKTEAINPELVTAHKVKLQSLKPNTKYYYFISSTDPNGNTSVSNTHSVTTKKP